MDNQDNIVFIFDDRTVKKPGTEIDIRCPTCKARKATVLYATQQPCYDDDEVVAVLNYLIIRCNGRNCDLVGQVDQDRFERVFPKR